MELNAIRRRLNEGGSHPVSAPDIAKVALGTTLHATRSAGGLDSSTRWRAPENRDLHSRAITVTVAGGEILVAGLDDLIAMTRAAGRPLDLPDIADLTEPDR